MRSQNAAVGSDGLLRIGRGHGIHMTYKIYKSLIFIHNIPLLNRWPHFYLIDMAENYVGSCEVSACSHRPSACIFMTLLTLF